jgi:hypothetical protein
MLTGKRFRLTWDTLAIESVDEKRIAITVPMGEIVEVIRGPRPDDTRMIEVRWNGKVLVMFAEDVEGRGSSSAEERRVLEGGSCSV